MAGYAEVFPRLWYGASNTVYSQVVDSAGAAFISFQGILDVSSAGSGNDTWVLTIEHSNVNEDPTFVDSGVSPLTISGTTGFLNVTQFGRYFRAKLVTGSSASGFFRGVATLKDAN
jgi:hypothetical protein